MQIYKAAAQGDVTAVLRELESGVPVDVLDEDYRTPLIVATNSEQSGVAMMQLLLDWGADPNAFGGDEYRVPVLLGAVGLGDIARIQCLLDAGADINLITEECMDALTFAVSSFVHFHDHRLVAVVEFLLERGTSVHYEEDGESALSVAFQHGHFEIVKRLLQAGADETRLKLNSLTRAIVLGTVDEVREQLRSGASLTERDKWGNRTPWLLSLSTGDIEKARLLLEAGAKRDDIGWHEKTTLMYPIEVNDPEMLHWLLSIGCDVDAAGDFGDTALMKAAEVNSVPCVQLLLDAGTDFHRVNRIKRNAIEFTSSMELARVLIEAGQDINNVSTHTRAFLFGVNRNDTFVLSREDAETGTQPRFGTANPERMDVPFWNAMVRAGQDSEARKTLLAAYDQKLWESCPGDYPFEKYPLWFYPRTGMSLTALPDGRFIEIGGYFEEGGNPNFCIYNEVFVHHPDRTLTIWGYPAEVFPPTDGHSATLVADFICIIGCIGHPEDRIVGYTPVYRLNTETLAIEKVETRGDNPGWIFNHKAILIGDEIHISGGETWTGPDSPEKIAENAAKMQKMVAFPVQEDYDSVSEWLEATGKHLNENMFEPPKSPERFALNLKSLNWRRLTD